MPPREQGAGKDSDKRLRYSIQMYLGLPVLQEGRPRGLKEHVLAYIKKSKLQI